ncbi:MAG: chemotaxis protein CheW [Alphaproteobacteria bacterium]
MTPDSNMHEFLTFHVVGQAFGISVLQVNDVLNEREITRPPLSPASIAGVMNLRGRIVTIIDVRRCLNQPPRPVNIPGMNIVIEQDGELISLLVDSVGDVMAIDQNALENVPPTLDSNWRKIASGIYKLPQSLWIIIEIKKLIELTKLSSIDFQEAV